MDLITLRQLIKEDRLVKFYQCPAWRKLRARVLDRDNRECQRCKDEGKVSTPSHPTTPRAPGGPSDSGHLKKDEENKIKSLHVHHIKEIKDFPELGLVYENLITLCQECHNKKHDRLKRKGKKKERFVNEERW